MDSCARWTWLQSLKLLRRVIYLWRSLPTFYALATSCCVSKCWCWSNSYNGVTWVLLSGSGAWVSGGGVIPVGASGCIGQPMQVRSQITMSPFLSSPSSSSLSPFLSSSPSSSFSACLHQSQLRGFLAVWGFPRWWLHVHLPPHISSFPVDKAPRAWAPPRRLNPRDPTFQPVRDGGIQWETPRPRGFPRQCRLSNKDRGEGVVGAEAAPGGHQGGGDGEHHQREPSWWRLGMVGGLRILHDPHRRWVKPPFICALNHISPFSADGITYSFGIFLVALIDKFNADRGYASLIPSILVGITLGAGMRTNQKRIKVPNTVTQ